MTNIKPLKSISSLKSESLIFIIGTRVVRHSNRYENYYLSATYVVSQSLKVKIHYIIYLHEKTTAERNTVSLNVRGQLDNYIL